jgi:protein-tyrosine phosphatase
MSAAPAAPSRSSPITRFVNWVLKRPVVVRVRRGLRDVRWRIKGRDIVNPPLPAAVRSVLFVCLGNICRSPFAGLIAARRLSEAGMSQIRSASAGIRTTQGGRSPQDACTAAAAYGLSLDAHQPAMLTREMMDSHDLIVVMESEQLNQLRAAYPDATGRIVLLSLFDERATGFERYNIADPFQRPLADYDACYRRIDRAVTALVNAVRLAS